MSDFLIEGETRTAGTGGIGLLLKIEGIWNGIIPTGDANTGPSTISVDLSKLDR